MSVSKEVMRKRVSVPHKDIQYKPEKVGREGGRMGGSNIGGRGESLT